MTDGRQMKHSRDLSNNSRLRSKSKSRSIRLENKTEMTYDDTDTYLWLLHRKFKQHKYASYGTLCIRIHRCWGMDRHKHGEVFTLVVRGLTYPASKWDKDNGDSTVGDEAVPVFAPLFLGPLGFDLRAVSVDGKAELPVKIQVALPLFSGIVLLEIQDVQRSTVYSVELACKDLKVVLGLDSNVQKYPMTEHVTKGGNTIDVADGSAGFDLSFAHLLYATTNPCFAALPRKKVGISGIGRNDFRQQTPYRNSRGPDEQVKLIMYERVGGDRCDHSGSIWSTRDTCDMAFAASMTPNSVGTVTCQKKKEQIPLAAATIEASAMGGFQPALAKDMMSAKEPQTNQREGRRSVLVEVDQKEFDCSIFMGNDIANSIRIPLAIKKTSDLTSEVFPEGLELVQETVVAVKQSKGCKSRRRANRETS